MNPKSKRWRFWPIEDGYQIIAWKDLSYLHQHKHQLSIMFCPCVLTLWYVMSWPKFFTVMKAMSHLFMPSHLHKQLKMNELHISAQVEDFKPQIWICVYIGAMLINGASIRRFAVRMKSCLLTLLQYIHSTWVW